MQKLCSSLQVIRCIIFTIVRYKNILCVLLTDIYLNQLFSYQKYAFWCIYFTWTAQYHQEQRHITHHWIAGILILKERANCHRGKSARRIKFPYKHRVRNHANMTSACEYTEYAEGWSPDFNKSKLTCYERWITDHRRQVNSSIIHILYDGIIQPYPFFIRTHYLM